MSQRCSIEASARLTLSAKQLLMVLQKLKSPEIPGALRGVPGLLLADEILKQRNARGLLIGGVSESVHFGYGRTRLERHKDVDVLVFDDYFELTKTFEGGIDWWLPHNRRVRFSSDSSSGDQQVRYWQNCNNVCLCFGAQIAKDSPAGLYLPPTSYLKAMRIHEIEEGVKHPTPPDEDALSRIRERMDSQLSAGPCKTIAKLFEGRRLDSSKVIQHPHEVITCPTSVGFYPLRLELAVAIRGGCFVDEA